MFIYRWNYSMIEFLKREALPQRVPQWKFETMRHLSPSYAPPRQHCKAQRCVVVGSLVCNTGPVNCQFHVYCVRQGVRTCCDWCWVIFRLPARVSCLYCLTQHWNFAGVAVEFEPKRKFDLFWSVQGEWKLLFYSSKTQLWQYTYPKIGCNSIFFLFINVTMRSKKGTLPD